MPKTMVDIRDFNHGANNGGNADVGVRFTTAGDPVAVSDETRTVTFVFSDESVDRYGDVIFARGWELANYKANPVVLFGHDSGSVENVIGRAKNVRVEGARLIGDVEFMGAEVNPKAEAVFQMVKGGYLKTGSVGFQPIDWECAKDKSRPQGVNFKKQELLEYSIVPIPANPNALALAKAAGIDIARLGFKAEPAGPAPATPRALAKTYRKKGLYELASLCDLIAYATYICICIEDEAEHEGDNSPLPARMREWINEGNRIIAAMAQEETAENIQEPAAVEDEVARGVQKALTALGLVKAGKTISTANEKKLRAAHEHLTSAAECVLAVVEPPSDEEGGEETDDEDQARALRARKARALQLQQAASI